MDPSIAREGSPVKQFCYVIVCARYDSNVGLISSYPFRQPKDPWIPKEADLPTLLQAGWRPVRESPLGGVGDGRSAFGLVLLEKDEPGP